MPDDFHALLDTAVQSRGSDYREARDALTNTEDYHTDLGEVLYTTDDWRTRWVARIALAWRTDADLFGEADTYLRGDLEGPRPITGTFGVEPRARRVRGLGDDVIPRLVEAAWKTQEYDRHARGAVFEALSTFDDPETEEKASIRPPLRSLFAAEHPEGYRTAAILTLGDLNDTESAAPLRDLLYDQEEPTPVRTAALTAYVSLERDDTLDTLKNVLKNDTNPESLRVEAASHLLVREVPGIRDLFHDLIPTVDEGLLLITLVDGLDTVGDDTSIPVLNTLQERVDDDYLLDLIDRVRSGLSDQ